MIRIWQPKPEAVLRDSDIESRHAGGPSEWELHRMRQQEKVHLFHSFVQVHDLNSEEMVAVLPLKYTVNTAVSEESRVCGELQKMAHIIIMDLLLDIIQKLGYVQWFDDNIQQLSPNTDVERMIWPMRIKATNDYRKTSARYICQIYQFVQDLDALQASTNESDQRTVGRMRASRAFDLESARYGCIYLGHCFNVDAAAQSPITIHDRVMTSLMTENLDLNRMIPSWRNKLYFVCFCKRSGIIRIVNLVLAMSSRNVPYRYYKTGLAGGIQDLSLDCSLHLDCQKNWNIYRRPLKPDYIRRWKRHVA